MDASGDIGDTGEPDAGGEDIVADAGDAFAEDVPLPDDADEPADAEDPGDTFEPGDAADASDGGDTGAPAPCGGFAGLTCDENSFCSYEPGTFCGGDDSLGECQPRPMGCAGEPSAPVCGCDGQPYASECKANQAGTSAASEGVCEGQCLTDAECQTSFSFCVQPDAPPSCGVCFNPLEPTCTTDDECGDGQVCDDDETPCLCEPQQVCQPACTPGSCNVGETCGDDGHCAPTTCEVASDCPAHFACAAGACARAACTEAADCPDGFCVQGQCYGQPGFCELPKP